MTIQSSKFIFFFVVLVFFSGCARNTNINENNYVATKNFPPAQTAETKKKPIKLLFVGDMMFDRYIRQAVGKYGEGNYNYVFGEQRGKLSEYDLVVGNLEGPITDKASTSVGTAMDEKRNLVFTFDPAVAKTLFESNIRLVNLGNNHILNQGEEGLVQTKKYLREAGVAYFGDTGKMEIESPRGDSISKVMEIGGTRIVFVGYNYSLAKSFEKAIGEIGEIRDRADFVIVCPHWGTEYKTGDPGSVIRDMARKFIDAGADVVIGTHPHVVQTSEEYKGKKIYFSLGNFIFDQYFSRETMEGLAVEVEINPSEKSMNFQEIPVEMKKKGKTVFEKKPIS